LVKLIKRGTTGSFFFKRFKRTERGKRSKDLRPVNCSIGEVLRACVKGGRLKEERLEKTLADTGRFQRGKRYPDSKGRIEMRPLKNNKLEAQRLGSLHPSLRGRSRIQKRREKDIKRQLSPLSLFRGPFVTLKKG